jgi:hypothetical protein
MMVTIYNDMYSKEYFHVVVEDAIARIKNGISKDMVESVRLGLEDKKNLPAVCFSGMFKERKDDAIISHSGFIVFDFDKVGNVQDKIEELKKSVLTYACWISPSGNGVKSLVRIENGKYHREYFNYIRENWQGYRDADRSGVNVSRLCFESYDPNLFLNEDSRILKEYQTIKTNETMMGKSKGFDSCMKWLTKRGDSFQTGERNRFIFLLASACCRFGVDEFDCQSEVQREFSFSNDFTLNEALKCIASAYRLNNANFGTVTSTFHDKTTNKELEIDGSYYDEELDTKDTIYAHDVYDDINKIIKNGYESVKGIGVEEIDTYWKPMKGELTCLTGIGNYGKSTFLKWYLISRALKYDEKFVLFSPEENPAHYFYHELMQVVFGTTLLPLNNNLPHQDKIDELIGWVNEHFFFISPKELAPTPKYLKERFLEHIIKNKVDGVVIDPWNQMSNNYGSYGGRSDKYLEVMLSDFARFGRENNIMFVIVAHPHKLVKDGTGNYPCPDVFDLADGAMWNNKLDNIIVFHRNNFQTDPNNSRCEFHSKKIRRQKSVGKRGWADFDYNNSSHRFTFMGGDPLVPLVIDKFDYEAIVKHKAFINDDDLF